MKLIYVCSPLRGDIEGNIKKANEYCREIAMQGNIPFAPHCVFTQFLDDMVAVEREMGIKMGLSLLPKCDELMVCGDRISEGMKEEIDLAYRLGVPVKFANQLLQEVYASELEHACGHNMAR